MQISTIHARTQCTSYPQNPVAIPPGELVAGRYAVRFARTPADLAAAQRLRYRVFNEELGEGLAGSHASGLDIDAVDARCHHLLVTTTDSTEVVGTYRVMTAEAAGIHGFYSEAEFDLGGLPADVVEDSVEAGRACVAAEHRNGRVVHLLWKGLAAYMAHNRRRYLFGCCSVPTLDPDVAFALDDRLSREGAYHARHRTAVRGAYREGVPYEARSSEAPSVAMPPLFASYLKLGATVLGGPAFDREFGVTDFFVLLDIASLEPHVRRAFFDRGLERRSGTPVSVGEA